MSHRNFGASPSPPCQSKKTNKGNGAVSKEIQRVSFQGLAIGKKPSGHFKQSKAQVESNNPPKSFAVPRIFNQQFFVSVAPAISLTFSHGGKLL